MTARGFRPNAVVRMAHLAAGVSERIGWRTTRRGGPVAIERALSLVVTGMRREAPDVVELTFATPDGRPLPGWRPGAHLDLGLPSGRVRQYSLCGNPGDVSCYRIAVRLLPDGDGGSREVHGLSPGTAVTVRGPRNAFPLVIASAYLFLAGGIGITPIAPMVRAAAARGAAWRLVHTGRDRASMPLSGELAATYSERVVLRPDNEHGGPPTAAELLAALPPGPGVAADLLTGVPLGSPTAAELPPGASVYCCGPPPMIEAVRRVVPAGHGFHAERFSPPPVRGGRPFTLELARSGVTVDVAADRSALDAVRAVLPDVAYSCRQGFCGTCHVPVLEGATEQNTALPGRMALCVARPAGERVVVDR